MRAEEEERATARFSTVAGQRGQFTVSSRFATMKDDKLEILIELAPGGGKPGITIDLAEAVVAAVAKAIDDDPSQMELSPPVIEWCCQMLSTELTDERVGFAPLIRVLRNARVRYAGEAAQMTEAEWRQIPGCTDQVLSQLKLHLKGSGVIAPYLGVKAWVKRLGWQTPAIAG